MGRGRLVIVGAGGFGRELLDVVESRCDADEQFEFIGFLDDGEVDTRLLSARHAELLGTSEQLGSLRADYLIGIGDSAARRRIDRIGLACRLSSPVVVHPSASIGAQSVLGPGTALTAGSRITTNVHIGRHVHVNLNATVGHDCIVGDYVSIAPGAAVSGNVVLEEGVTVGARATILPGIRVARGATIGAGSVVIRDVEEGATVFGLPAHALPR